MNNNTEREQRVSEVAKRVCRQASVVEVAAQAAVRAVERGCDPERAAVEAVFAVVAEAVRQAEAKVA